MYGVLRSYYSLEARLADVLERPLRHKDADIEALLLIGLYQLLYMRIPPHAAVSATVEAARELNKSWACALVNGVLRRALRDMQNDSTPTSECATFEHPQWLIDRVRSDWPQDWQSILRQGNAQAPLSLRINQTRTSVEDYAALLAARGYTGERMLHAPAGITLRDSASIQTLPHFDAGFVSVQDEAAQLAAMLVAPAPGERILDACAAPGGKATHMLELAGGALDLVAVDRAAERMARVAQNLARLGLACCTVIGDVAARDGWWDGRQFDKIMLDAPCSALGVMRRHPDIRLRRQAQDIAAMTREQQRLLQGIWPLLRVGGKLLYATCSILPAENDEVVRSLLSTQADARVVELQAQWGRPMRHGRQILPGENDMDGFYYAQLIKLPHI